MKRKVFLVYILIFFSVNAWASNGGVGGMAMNLLGSVDFVSDFVHTACLFLGVCFVFASIVKYFEHKRSPLMVPISTVVFLFVAGVVLILLPLISFYTESGVPYTLLESA